MAVYRIGDILRMKREALGITREKLCELSEEICSPQTLYRMECGKVKVKQDVYRKLMECMGELPERNYASIMVSKYQYLNLKSEIEVYLLYQEYEKAEQKLLQLEEVMDQNYSRNKQYLLEIKSYIAYCKEQICLEEYLEHLWEALRYTIPNIDKIDLVSWPYNKEELTILFDIVSLFSEKKWREKELELLLKLKENIERKYVEKDYYVMWHSQCLVRLSQLMSITNQHEQALEYCNHGMEEIKKQRLLGNIYALLYDMAWNKEQMIQKELLEKKEREFCKKLLVQAYYLSIAQKESHRSERIKRLCDHYYSGEIMLV